MAEETREQKRAAARERMTAYIKSARAKRNNKTAGLRRIAEEEPHEVGNALSELSQVFHDVAEIISGLAEDADGLKENLDLTEPGKTASIKERVAARRNYAKTLRRLANEEPEQIGAALSEIYVQLDEAAEGIEALSDRFGIPLNTEEIAAEVSGEASASEEALAEPAPEPAPGEGTVE